MNTRRPTQNRQAVGEESPAIGARTGSALKVRALRGVVSPAAPDYLHALVDDEAGAELAAGALEAAAGGGGGFFGTRPIAGARWQGLK